MMTSYVRQLFRSKRRKTESSSEENTEIQLATGLLNPPRTSSAAILSSNPTNSSMDFIISTLTSSASPAEPPRRTSAGHRRQHSSPGHLQQFQHVSHQTTTRFKRRNTDMEYDPNARPPKFKNRSPYYQSSGTLEPPDVRMILIEAESRVLFDTATVIPLRYGRAPAARSISPCGQFQFLRKRKDTVKLSQMIFGAVPNLKTSESFRIHVLEDEEMILVSKTFQIPKTKKGAKGKDALMDPTSSDSDSQNTVKSLDGWRTRASRSIMATPEGFNRVRHISITFGAGADDETDSQHLYGSPSSSISLPRAFSPPHRLSKARRRQLAVTTSLSETYAVPIPSSLKARSRMSSMSSTQNDEEHPQQSSSSGYSAQNMRNLALGILVPIGKRDFLMQHIPLIESEMSRFETRIVNAANHAPTFLQNISKSWEELTEIMCQLHNAPRLKHPYWLALNEKCQVDEKTLATEFCEQLAYLVRRYDRKEAGYFLSNLVTALLMHHMSWVASVATPPLANMDKRREREQYRAEQLFGMQTNGAPTVGYNALMAQYLEIAGSCGNTRSAKLCILGDDVEILASVCSVLSFFIRCSAVQHIDNDKMWEMPPEHPFSPVDVSGSPNSPSSTCCHHLHHVPTNAGFVHNPDETTSGAMMRRLRNNNTPQEPIPSTSAAIFDQEMGVQTTEITVISCPNHQSVTIIDRVDFPCCPTIKPDDEMWVPRPNSEGLGRSMFAGPLDDYCPHFVLSALLKKNANMPDVYSRMFDEVRCQDTACHRASTSFHSSVSSSQSSSSICDPIVAPENVLIVADIENMTVKVLSAEGSDEVTSPSESVVAMLEQFVGIHDAVPSTAEFLVGIIEDSLAHLVGKSLTLVELVRSDQSKNPSSLQLTPDRVRTIIGCDHSDLRLIVNVAAVYWPPVLQSVLG